MTNDEKPSWGKFFAGCALILLVVGGGIWGLWTLQQRGAATVQAVRTQVLQPYWDALPRADFADVCARICTPERNRACEPVVIAAKYASFSKANGALKQAEIYSCAEGGTIGSAVQTMDVKVNLTFDHDRTLTLTYKLQRQNAQDSWKIDRVTTKDRAIELPTF